MLHDKRRVKSLMDGIVCARSGALRERLAEAYHPDAHWRGSHPLNELHGVDAIEHTVWAPLHRAFPDLERRDRIFMGGTQEGGVSVNALD